MASVPPNTGNRLAMPGRPFLDLRQMLRIRRFNRLGGHLRPEPVHGGLDAAVAVRDAERLERHLDDAQRAEDHRRVDMAHMRDAERLAGEVADAVAEDE